jgi:GT2 family glycosyltransferase
MIEFTAPIIKKRVFEKIGLLDGDFKRGYGVEFDFCYRAKQEGFRLWVDDSNHFIHKGQCTINKHEGIIAYSSKANIELNHVMLNKYGYNWRNIMFEDMNIDPSFDMKISVYTTIYGDYAHLKPIPQQTIKANYYCITDNKELTCPGWETIVQEAPSQYTHPRMKAKYFKLFPWAVKHISDSDVSIYIDGSIEVKSNRFIEYCIKHLDDDFTLFRHPQRNCIYEEIEASKPLKKYQSENLVGQGNSYKKEHPANWGLWACGVMVRKQSDKIKKLMADWMNEINKWTYQDQISFPVVCKRNNFIPTSFPDNQYSNDYFNVIWHDDGVKEKPLKTPTVSVLMPIYNTPIEILKEAVESILKQTYKDLEVVVVVDCGTKEILSYLKSIDKVKVIENDTKNGVAYALNLGLQQCSGNLIVRMDGDDIADPTLIDKQVKFFQRHPHADVCGVQLKSFGAQTIVSRHPYKVTRNMAAKNDGCWFLNHPGVAYRKSVVMSVGGYDSSLKGLPEDYDLWCRLLNEGYVIYNQQEILINYRITHNKPSPPEWIPFLESRRNSLKTKMNRK